MDNGGAAAAGQGSDAAFMVRTGADDFGSWADELERRSSSPRWDYGWCAVNALSAIPWEVRMHTYASILDWLVVGGSGAGAGARGAGGGGGPSVSASIVKGAVHMSLAWVALINGWKESTARTGRDRQSFVGAVAQILQRTDMYSLRLPTMDVPDPAGAPDPDEAAARVRLAARKKRAKDELDALKDILSAVRGQVDLAGQRGFGLNMP